MSSLQTTIASVAGAAVHIGCFTSPSTTTVTSRSCISTETVVGATVVAVSTAASVNTKWLRAITTATWSVSLDRGEPSVRVRCKLARPMWYRCNNHLIISWSHMYVLTGGSGINLQRNLKIQRNILGYVAWPFCPIPTHVYNNLHFLHNHQIPRVQPANERGDGRRCYIRPGWRALLPVSLLCRHDV